MGIGVSGRRAVNSPTLALDEQKRVVIATASLGVPTGQLTTKHTSNRLTAPLGIETRVDYAAKLRAVERGNIWPARPRLRRGRCRGEAVRGVALGGHRGLPRHAARVPHVCADSPPCRPHAVRRSTASPAQAPKMARLTVLLALACAGLASAEPEGCIATGSDKQCDPGLKCLASATPARAAASATKTYAARTPGRAPPSSTWSCRRS